MLKTIGNAVRKFDPVYAVLVSTVALADGSRTAHGQTGR